MWLRHTGQEKNYDVAPALVGGRVAAKIVETHKIVTSVLKLFFLKQE
jgi:hypothetical protein